MMNHLKVGSVLQIMPKQNKQNKGQKKGGKKGGKVAKTTPVAKNYSVKTRPARFTSLGTTIRVQHSEFAGDMVGYGLDYYVDALRINPANSNLFPWLSGMAMNYEAYEFKSLAFRYVPTCSSLTSGSIAMMVDFDAADPTPTSKEEILNSKCHRSVAARDQVTLTVSKDDEKTLGTRRFTLRSDPYNAVSVVYPPRTDPRTYDLGYFNIAVCGVPMGAVGELYVDYVVDLITPQMPAVVTPMAVSASIKSGGVTDKNHIFGTVPEILGDLVKNHAVYYLNNKARLLLPKFFEGLITWGMNGVDVKTPSIGIVDDAGNDKSGTHTEVYDMLNTANGPGDWREGTTKFKVHNTTGDDWFLEVGNELSQSIGFSQFSVGMFPFNIIS